MFIKNIIFGLAVALTATTSLAVNCVENNNCAKDQLKSLIRIKNQNETQELNSKNTPLIYFRNENNKGVFYDPKITKVIISKDVFTDSSSPSLFDQKEVILNKKADSRAIEFEVENMNKTVAASENLIKELKNEGVYFLVHESSNDEVITDGIYFAVKLNMMFKINDEDSILKDMYLVYGGSNGSWFVGGKNCTNGTAMGDSLICDYGDDPYHPYKIAIIRDLSAIFKVELIHD